MKKQKKLFIKNKRQNMRTLLRIGICLLLVAGFAACNKNETPVIGKLEIRYVKNKANFVSVYTEAENKIYSLQNPPSNLSIELNPGNYSISTDPKSSGNYNNYFQIQAGRTTLISYYDWGPLIEYK